MEAEIRKILEFLRDKKIWEIVNYDVKLEDRELQGYIDENYKNYSSSDRTKDTMDKLSPWERMCYYKVSGTTGTDCDVALFNMVTYYLAYGLGKEGWRISNGQLEKQGANWDFRGDTMNSYATSVHECIRRVWRPGHKKEMIGKGILDEKGEVNSELKENYWEDVILHHYDYFQEALPISAREYIRIDHTIGNFIPVPFGGEEKGYFNGPRGYEGKSQDYWDLALLAFYKHYHPDFHEFAYMKDPLIWLLSNQTNAKLCKEWLNSFGTWDAFVEHNFMQDFVNQQNGQFGLPKELWIGHFKQEVPVLPRKYDFDQFFTNASAWIAARGTRIAIKIKEELKGQDLAALAEKMANQ